MEILGAMLQGYNPILLFILICFAALLVMFYRVLRSLDDVIRVLHPEQDSLQEHVTQIRDQLVLLVRSQAETTATLQRLAEAERSLPPRVEAPAAPRPAPQVWDESPPPAAPTRGGFESAPPSAAVGVAAGVVAGAATAAAMAAPTLAEPEPEATLHLDEEEVFTLDWSSDTAEETAPQQERELLFEPVYEEPAEAPEPEAEAEDLLLLSDEDDHVSPFATGEPAPASPPLAESLEEYPLDVSDMDLGEPLSEDELLLEAPADAEETAPPAPMHGNEAELAGLEDLLLPGFGPEEEADTGLVLGEPDRDETDLGELDFSDLEATAEVPEHFDAAAPLLDAELDDFGALEAQTLGDEELSFIPVPEAEAGPEFEPEPELAADDHEGFLDLDLTVEPAAVPQEDEHPDDVLLLDEPLPATPEPEAAVPPGLQDEDEEDIIVFQPRPQVAEQAVPAPPAVQPEEHEEAEDLILTDFSRLSGRPPEAQAAPEPEAGELGDLFSDSLGIVPELDEPEPVAPAGPDPAGAREALQALHEGLDEADLDALNRDADLDLALGEEDLEEELDLDIHAASGPMEHGAHAALDDITLGDMAVGDEADDGLSYADEADIGFGEPVEDSFGLPEAELDEEPTEQRVEFSQLDDEDQDLDQLIEHLSDLELDLEDEHPDDESPDFHTEIVLEEDDEPETELDIPLVRRVGQTPPEVISMDDGEDLELSDDAGFAIDDAESEPQPQSALAPKGDPALSDAELDELALGELELILEQDTDQDRGFAATRREPNLGSIIGEDEAADLTFTPSHDLVFGEDDDSIEFHIEEEPKK